MSEKQNITTDTITYSVCHNVDDGMGFFTMSNREELCDTLEKAVIWADRFNEVTKSKGYRATATKNYALLGGYVSSIVYKVIGVSPDGLSHDYLSYNEYPVEWITEAEFESFTDSGEDSRIKMLGNHDAAYFCFTRAKIKAMSELLLIKLEKEQAEAAAAITNAINEDKK
jgi:hypothetical protein